eukprot:2139873-Pyramimonas_sp.AAC.3
MFACPMWILSVATAEVPRSALEMARRSSGLSAGGEGFKTPSGIQGRLLPPPPPPRATPMGESSWRGAATTDPQPPFHATMKRWFGPGGRAPWTPRGCARPTWPAQRRN